MNQNKKYKIMSNIMDILSPFMTDMIYNGYDGKSYRNLLQGIEKAVFGEQITKLTDDQVETMKRDADRKLLEETQDEEEQRINYLEEQ